MDSVEAALGRARAAIFNDHVDAVVALEALYHVLELLVGGEQAEPEAAQAPASEG